MWIWIWARLDQSYLIAIPSQQADINQRVSAASKICWESGTQEEKLNCMVFFPSDFGSNPLHCQPSIHCPTSASKQPAWDPPSFSPPSLHSPRNPSRTPYHLLPYLPTYLSTFLPNYPHSFIPLLQSSQHRILLPPPPLPSTLLRILSTPPTQLSTFLLPTYLPPYLPIFLPLLQSSQHGILLLLHPLPSTLLGILSALLVDASSCC